LKFGDLAIYVFDKDESLAKAFGAKTSTDVIVIDPSRTVAYHGAIDDQYGLGYSIDAPRYRYLTEALDALLDRRKMLVSATAAPGCMLDIDPKKLSANLVTYHQQVSRLLQYHCVDCHREGGVGPFALDTYDDAVAHAPMIREVIDRGIMPPWFAATNAKGLASPWINDRSLSVVEKEEILGWIANGKVAGDPKDSPQPKTYPGGWLIGKPHAEFQFAKPVQIKATGTMPYQNVVVETNLPEDKWVQAIEVRPGNLSVVHHVLVFIQVSDEENGPRDDGADKRSGYWGIYVPGNSSTRPNAATIRNFFRSYRTGTDLGFEKCKSQKSTNLLQSYRVRPCAPGRMW